MKRTLIRYLTTTAIGAILPLQPLLAGDSVAFTAEKAVKLAKAELAQRHLPLPHRYRINVSRSTQYGELQEDRSIFIVSFRLEGKTGKAARLFDVNIDRATRKVLYVNDLRRNVPGP